MTNHLFVAFLSMLMFSPAYAQIASEVPLTNPEVIEAPSRQQGISKSPDEEIAETEDEQAKVKPSAPDADLESDQLLPKMTLERMVSIVRALDENANVQDNAMQLNILGVAVTVVTDVRANRMRAFSPFKNLDGVDGQSLYRMMQANFDSTLDARYAIAKGHLIATFIHPFAELQKEQLIEGIGQVVNLVKTYGTAYTSGAMTFGGGDSRNLHRQLIEELLKKGEEI